MQEDKNVKKKGFLKGMKAELKKVIWPTGNQVVKSTFVTIAFVLIISVILVVLNLFFNWLSTTWINHLPHDETIINSAISGEVSDEISDVLSGENTLHSGETNIDEVVSGE